MILSRRRQGYFGFLSLVFLVLSQCIPSSRVYGQSPLVQYFAIEDVSTGDAVWRGTTTREGIPSGSVILMPETRYRLWRYEVSSKLFATKDFETPAPGQVFDIPEVHGFEFRQTVTGDEDGDDLSDEAEWIIGTDGLNPDSDDDGILDGAELEQGLNPLDGIAVQTGIVVSVDTDGAAQAVDALNNLAVVADSDRGISVFNIFGGMDPTIITQADTIGTARDVTLVGGDSVGVAANNSGFLLFDISDPPNNSLTFSIPPDQIGGGNCICVSSQGDFAFVGTDQGWVASIDVASQVLLSATQVGTRVEDLQPKGENLYVHAAGELVVLQYLNGPLRVIGRAASPGTSNSDHGRGGLFVGQDIAYPVHSRGYNTLDIRGATDPFLITASETAQLGWRNLALPNPSVGLAAVGPNRSLSNQDSLSVYDTSDPIETDVFVNEIVTPGSARDVTIYNGLAYVADNGAGLQVINFRTETDRMGFPPTGILELSVEDVAVEGSLIVLSASVTDDVQVRNVTFLVNDQNIGTDGNYPFEVGYRIPSGFAGDFLSISAVARDMSGNSTTLGPTQVQVVEDSEPPQVTLVSLRDTAGQTEIVTGDQIQIDIGLFDNAGIDIDSVRFLIDGQEVSARRINANRYILDSPSQPGNYSLSVLVSDFSGNQNALMNLAFAVYAEAISRFVSVYNTGDTLLNEAISRSVSVYNTGADPSTKEALSRAVSVEVEDASKGRSLSNTDLEGSVVEKDE